MFPEYSLLFVDTEIIETGITLLTEDHLLVHTEATHPGEDCHPGEETGAGLVLAHPHHTAMVTPGPAW